MIAPLQPPHPTSASPEVRVAVAAEAVAAKKGHRSLTVPFDDETWAQLEAVSTTFGLPKTGSVRRCVRLAAWILENLKDGYKIGLLKKGESPRLVELM
jgi:hypothetical protein